jgi:antitoxin HicB
MRYALILAPDDNGTILVTVPDISQVVTFGDDKEDALARAVDAIETALIGFMDAKEPIPMPKANGKHSVTLPALSVAKIGLYEAMRSQGVGKAAMSRKLGVALPQIDRLLDLKHHSRMDAVERALAAMGQCLTISVQAA